MQERLSRFRVGVTKLKPLGGVQFNGEFGMCASFRIEPLNGGSVHGWEGNAGGGDFIYRCERLKKEPIVIDAPEPPFADVEVSAKNIVYRALAQVTL